MEKVKGYIVKNLYSSDNLNEEYKFVDYQVVHDTQERINNWNWRYDPLGLMSYILRFNLLLALLILEPTKIAGRSLLCLAELLSKGFAVLTENQVVITYEYPGLDNDD